MEALSFDFIHQADELRIFNEQDESVKNLVIKSCRAAVKVLAAYEAIPKAEERSKNLNKLILPFPHSILFLQCLYNFFRIYKNSQTDLFTSILKIIYLAIGVFTLGSTLLSPLFKSFEANLKGINLDFINDYFSIREELKSHGLLLPDISQFEEKFEYLKNHPGRYSHEYWHDLLDLSNKIDHNLSTAGDEKTSSNELIKKANREAFDALFYYQAILRGKDVQPWLFIGFLMSLFCESVMLHGSLYIIIPALSSFLLEDPPFIAFSIVHGITFSLTLFLLKFYLLFSLNIVSHKKKKCQHTYAYSQLQKKLQTYSIYLPDLDVYKDKINENSSFDVVDLWFLIERVKGNIDFSC